LLCAYGAALLVLLSWAAREELGEGVRAIGLVSIRVVTMMILVVVRYDVYEVGLMMM
jgi:hypothetical protein